MMAAVASAMPSMKPTVTMVEMPYGGAKATIMGDPNRDQTRPLLVAYAKAVDRMGGRLFTGCDMGLACVIRISASAREKAEARCINS